MRSLAFLAAALLLPAAANATPPNVRPVAVGEVDYRLHAAEHIEGEDGFVVNRFRLGVAADFTPWCSVLGQAEWAREKPVLLDAFVTLRPAPSWEVRVGASKTPLFSTGRDEMVFALPIPERSMPTRAFWAGRDVGIELHRFATQKIPVEGWLRVGNGSGNVLGNDNSDYALDARLDLAFGRALQGVPSTPLLGLRVGAGIHLQSAEDRPGITATTPDNYIFYHAPTISGPRRVVEAHAIGFIGPVKVTAEGALAKESRSKDTDGNPKTPRIDQAAVESRGGSVEVAWMVTGQRRKHNEWPVRTPWNKWDWGALEVAGRVDRVDLAMGAADVKPGGATAGAVAVRWWTTSFLAASAAWYYTSYDAPPVEEPDRSSSWLGLLRLTVRVQ